MSRVFSLRTKLEVAGTICLLISLSLVSVFAVTRTISDTGDTVETFIRNSNGNYYSATAANLQLAIWNLNNQSGWVDGGMNNISITTTIQGSNNLELRHVKLFLATGANTSLLKPKNNSKIIDCNFDGNCWGQDASYLVSFYRTKNIITIRYTNNVLIENCNLTNAQIVGIYTDYSKNITIVNCRISNSGAHLEAHSTLAYFTSGIWIANTENTIITNCLAYNCYSCGFLMEGSSGASEKTRTREFLIDNCIAEKSCNGFYAEDAGDGIFSNCLAVNCNKTTIYGGSHGFIVSGGTKNINLVGCTAKYCGGYTGSSAGANIYVASGAINCNSSISNCYSINGSGDGIQVGSDVKVSQCTVQHANNTGIYGFGRGISIENCDIHNSKSKGILFSSNSVANAYGKISGCIVTDAVGYSIDIGSNNVTVTECIIRNGKSYGISIYSNLKGLIISDNSITNCITYGIYSWAGGMQNCTISGNIIDNCGTGIYVRMGSNNTFIGNLIKSCTIGFDETTGDYNMYTGNNCLGCTNGYDINGVHYKPTGQTNFTNFNFGTWT